MKKIRITMTIVKEFAPCVDNYEGLTDINDMAEMDRQSFDEDPMTLVEWADSITTIAEVIE